MIRVSLVSRKAEAVRSGRMRNDCSNKSREGENREIREIRMLDGIDLTGFWSSEMPYARRQYQRDILHTKKRTGKTTAERPRQPLSTVRTNRNGGSGSLAVRHRESISVSLSRAVLAILRRVKPIVSDRRALVFPLRTRLTGWMCASSFGE